jgi:hypothetical protein
MSAISEKVRTAIYAKTNVGTVVGSGKLTGIFADKAPATQSFPYGIFNRQASEPVQYAFNVTQILESDLWQFRVYAVSQSQAETLLTAWLNALGNAFTLTGNTVVWCARVNDLPPTDQQLTDSYVYGRGALVSIKTE